MGLLNGQFRPNDSVTRVSLAYSMVQALGLQEQATAFTGPIMVFYDGKRISLDDEATIAPARGGERQHGLGPGGVKPR